jgi:hypothetical protein
MVVTTNTVGDPSIENKWGSLLHQQVRLKKIIVRITWVRYGVGALSSALNEAVSRRRRREPRFYQTGQRSASHPGGALD